MAPANLEEVARASHGRLLALLAARTGDIAAAEDALAEAYLQALQHWPRETPAHPEAWLFTVARNRERNRLTSAAHRTRTELSDIAEPPTPNTDPDAGALHDRRLELMFVCAHPAIDEAARAPLMLQTVLGLPTNRIADAFALPAPTLAQRLTRAKRRIKDASPEASSPSSRRSTAPTRSDGASPSPWKRKTSPRPSQLSSPTNPKRSAWPR